MSTLAKKEILSRLKSKDDDAIIVTPILDLEKQINQIGIDCRLGNQFIILKPQNVTSYDIDSTETRMGYHKEIVVPFGVPFVLHPQTMVLGSTFEFVSLPNDITATIEGRSSWARAGLIIATASYIDPGFKGCITLEIANISSIPIKLYPGTRIAQLIFNLVSSKSKYEFKKYNIPIGPEISKIKSDFDNHIFMSSFS